MGSNVFRISKFAAITMKALLNGEFGRGVHDTIVEMTQAENYLGLSFDQKVHEAERESQRRRVERGDCGDEN